MWQDIAAQMENLVVKAHHVPKPRATEEHQNNQQVDQASRTQESQVNLEWQLKGKLFLAWWAHNTLRHQGGDAT